MAETVLLQPVQSGRNYRAIGPEAAGGPSGGLIFQADVTEREEHHNSLVITEHPVENTSGVGGVADHAYRRPQEVHLKIAWSNSGHDDPSFVQSVFEDLRKFQRDRWPMDLYTGKSAYSNMLIADIIVDTDQTSEYALHADLHMREVILVRTQSFSVSSDPSVQADPSSTQPTVDEGTKQPITGGFNQLRSGDGPTEIPTGAAANPASNIGSDLSAPSSPVPQEIPTGQLTPFAQRFGTQALRP